MHTLVRTNKEEIRQKDRQEGRQRHANGRVKAASGKKADRKMSDGRREKAGGTLNEGGGGGTFGFTCWVARQTA